MDNKRFFIYSLIISALILIILFVGLANTLLNTVPGYDFCSKQEMRFMKGPIKIERAPVVKCRDRNGIFCFDLKTKEEIGCSRYDELIR